MAKRLFVRQNNPDDCGLACLAMILNYTGQRSDSVSIMKEKAISGGFSLMQLKTLSRNYGLEGLPVEMDISHLRTLRSPCILHTENRNGDGHYVVCFGFKNGLFIIADPAGQVHRISAGELELCWRSRTAIYFGDLSPKFIGNFGPTWSSLLSFVNFPWSILPAISLLTLVTATSGVALTWYFQRALIRTDLVQPKAITIVIILLILIGVSRAITNIIKQRLMIRISLSFNMRLMQSFLGILVKHSIRDKRNMPSVKVNLVDIQKMQNGISAFVATVVGDGSMIVVMLIMIAFTLPAIAIIDIVLITFVLWLFLRHSVQSAYLMITTNSLSTKYEDDLSKIVGIMAGQFNSDLQGRFFEQNNELLSAAENVSVRTGKFIFGTESIGVLALAAVTSISLGLYQLGSCSMTDAIASSALTYVSFNLLPKICSAMEVVGVGADAAVQFDRLLDH